MSMSDAMGSCTRHELILEADILEQNSVAGGRQCSCQRQGRWRQVIREARTQTGTHKARRENVNEGLPWEEDREEQWGARQLGVGWEETGRPAASKSQGTIKGILDPRRTRKWS